MDVSYNKLFKMLIDKEMKKTEFAKQLVLALIRLQNSQEMKRFRWISSFVFAEHFIVV